MALLLNLRKESRDYFGVSSYIARISRQGFKIGADKIFTIYSNCSSPKEDKIR